MCTQTLAAANAANPLLQAHYPGLPASQAAPAPQQQQPPPALFMPKAHHHHMKQRLHDFARSQMRNEHTGTTGDPPTAPRVERCGHRSECYRFALGFFMRPAVASLCTV